MRSAIAHLADQSVRYLEAGSGRSLVLLHAFPLSADQWLPQLSRVPPGWRFIAPDLRGLRGAGPAFEVPLPEDISMDVYAADVLSLMTHLEVEDAVVAGLSMGGYVAFAMWREAPSRIRGLVLADTRATPDTEQQRAARDRMIALAESEGAPGVAREMTPKLLGETTRREQPDLAEVIDRSIRMNRPEAIAAALRALKTRPDSRPILASITCPTCILCGEEDVLTPVADSEAMHEAIAGSRLAVLAGAGHLSNLEAPIAFSAELARGLSSS